MKSAGDCVASAPGVGNGADRERWTAEAGLGKLVQFDLRSRAAKVRPAKPGTAQIVIFTGVRYQRDGTPIPGKPLGNVRPKRKRV